MQAANQYEGSLAVRLDIADDSGTQLGQATARIAQSRPANDGSPRATQAALYEMTRQMMRDMNVEFEYQVRRTLKSALESSTSAAPPPGPVQSETLPGSPPSPEQAVLPPAAAQPSAAPPPGPTSLAPPP